MAESLCQVPDNRLEKVAALAMSCADRIVGNHPSAVENEKDGAHSPTLIYAVQSRRGRLARAVDRLEDEMRRIEAGLA